MKKTLIYVTLIFAGITASCTEKTNVKQTLDVDISAAELLSISIATVDTDSILANYDMVADMTRELAATEKRLSDDLQRQARNWQNDYDNYLKIGATMTLSEQRKREEQLRKRREEDLPQLEQRYMQQLMELNTRKNREIEDKIFSFIEEYNKKHGNFTIILSKSRSSGVLYALPSMDITQPVLDAMNEEYSKTRGK